MALRAGPRARRCNQNYTTFWSFFFSIVVFYGAVGFFFASLFTIGDDPPNVLGGYPSDICSLAYPALRSNCKDLQSNQFFALMGSIVFIQIAMAAATTSATFGCETAQYARRRRTSPASDAVRRRTIHVGAAASPRPRLRGTTTSRRRVASSQVLARVLGRPQHARVLLRQVGGGPAALRRLGDGNLGAVRVHLRDARVERKLLRRAVTPQFIRVRVGLLHLVPRALQLLRPDVGRVGRLVGAPLQRF